MGHSIRVASFGARNGRWALRSGRSDIQATGHRSIEALVEAKGKARRNRSDAANADERGKDGKTKTVFCAGDAVA